jgi:hypothetical protein
MRIILLIGNALLLAFFAYVVIDSSVIHPRKEAILDYVITVNRLIFGRDGIRSLTSRQCIAGLTTYRTAM